MPYGNDECAPSKPYVAKIATPTLIQPCRLRPSPLPHSPKVPCNSHRTRQSVISFEEPSAQSIQPPDTHPSPDLVTFRSLFAFTSKRHTPILIFSVLCSILASLVPAFQSYLLGKIFASFAKFGAGAATTVDFKDELARYNVYLIGLGALCWSFGSSLFAGWTWFGGLQARSANETLFHGLVNRSMSWFDQRQSGIGALITKIHGQTKDLEISTSLSLGMAIRDIVTSLSCFGLAFYFSWKLTLMMLSTIPIIAILMPLLSSRILPNIERQTTHLTVAAKHATNAFSDIDTVKCYNGHQQQQQRYAQSIKQAARYYICQVNWHALQSSVLRFITLSMFVQGFWFGSTLVGKNPESAGPIFTAFWSCLIATNSLMAVMPHMMQFENGKVAGSQLRAMIAASSEPLTSSLRQIRSHAHDINVRNVWFVYPTQPYLMVLRGVDLSFPVGDFTFVVGKSGSGKSTIGQLLTKLYEPLEGTILIGDFNIRSIGPSWIRNNILLVEQESVLFNATVRENIALGKDNPAMATTKEIEDAAEFSSILDAILAIPDGFNTIVGSKGVALSGGQLQRVALARARLRDPPILILDECTSALDQINRLAVMDAIRHWRKGKTTIVITHDISQIYPSDFVYVMDRGQVVEEGFRKALVKTKGSLFQELVRSPKPSARTDRFASTNMRVPSEYDDRDANGTSLYLRRQNSMKYLSDKQSVNRRSSRWISAIGTPLVGGWAPRESIEIPQSLVHRQSIVYNPPKRPKSPGFRGSRPESPRSPNFDQFGWASPTVRSHAQFPTYSKELETEEPEFGDTWRVKANGSETNQKRAKEYTMKSILGTVWPALTSFDRFFLIVGFSAAFVYAASTPVFAHMISKLLKTFYNPIDRKTQALKYSLVILSIAAGDALMLFITLSLVQRVGHSWVNNLRSKALGRILNQPREFFDQEENGVSQMTSCLDHHAEEMQHILGRFAGNVLIVVMTLTVAIVWSIVNCWKLTLVMLACTPAILLITKALSNVAGKIETQVADEEERAASIFAEAFNNIKTVRTLTLEGWFRTKHQIAVEAVLKTKFKEGIYVGTFFGLSQATLLFIMALIFHYGGVLLSSYQFNLNSIVQVLALLIFSIATATTTLASIPQLSACRESASRLLRLANLPSDSHEVEGDTIIQSVNDIIFRNVHFSYPSRPDQVVFKGLNLIIQAGTSVALVGISGSGKSSIAALLLKLYATSSDTENSCITISGHNINSIHTQTLRNLITIVSQKPTLFPTSISANIVYGLRRGHPLNNATNVRASAIAAGIHEFISSLPNGYDTIIGEGGMGLSGGQAQRVAIARALARRPNVLLLDEATSALDQESAGVIRDSILRLRREQKERGEKVMTVIVITHSRDMMSSCDRVVMLDQGSVVEEGAYAELLMREGGFARLMRGRNLGEE